MDELSFSSSGLARSNTSGWPPHIRYRVPWRACVMLEAMQASSDCAPAFAALASTQTCTSGVMVAQLMNSLPRARRSRPPL